MVKQIIPSNPILKKTFQKQGEDFLNISEFYCDTIQGEGIYIGQPASFLRLKGCVMECSYCDTREVWRYGNPYTFRDLYNLISEFGLDDKLKNGHHLVITGGSPLLQQKKLCQFLSYFSAEFGIKPFVEIENECVINPIPEIFKYVNCWNNSPKLASSNIDISIRYKPEIIRRMSLLPNSWFKFVVSKEEDWEEIEIGFLRLIERKQIILMPEGVTKAELERNRPIALEMAIENNVRFTDRLHITIWDRKVGV